MRAATKPAVAGYFCILLALLLTCQTAAALSDSVCDNTAATWNTDSPKLTGHFPFYSLLFFCEGDLNLESLGVDACVGHGSSCGQSAADEFCQYLGFGAAVSTLFTTKTANGPIRSMTGEWCVQSGRYEDLGYLNRTQLDSLNSTVSGPYCQRLDSVVCYNSRERLAANNNALHPVVSAAQPPQALSSSASSPATSQGSGSIITSSSRLPPSSSIGGRRRLLS